MSLIYNVIINGRFDFWQRPLSSSAPLKVEHVSGIGIADRAYGPDRWYAYVRDDGYAASKNTVIMEPVRTNPPFDSLQKAIRVTVNSGGQGVSGKWCLIQEIDRQMIRFLYNKKVTLRYTMRKRGFLGNEPTVSILYGTVELNYNQRTVFHTSTSKGYPTVVSAADVTPQLTESFQNFTLSTSTIIPASTTEMAVVIQGNLDDSIFGDYIEISEVSLVPGDIASSEFQWAGGTYQARAIGLKEA